MCALQNIVQYFLLRWELISNLKNLYTAHIPANRPTLLCIVVSDDNNISVVKHPWEHIMPNVKKEFEEIFALEKYCTAHSYEVLSVTFESRRLLFAAAGVRNSRWNGDGRCRVRFGGCNASVER